MSAEAGGGTCYVGQLWSGASGLGGGAWRGANAGVPREAGSGLTLGMEGRGMAGRPGLDGGIRVGAVRSFSIVF